MISFFDLAAQQAEIKDRIDENIARVLSHGNYILGPEVDQLEEVLSTYTGVKHCITCANGTDALQIALMGLGVGVGDEVISPAFSYIAAAEAVALLGANNRFVDVDPETCNVDPDKLECAISNRTKAIIVVSLYGQCPEMDRINEIAKKYSIPVIEDAAQSFGAEYKGRKSCNLTDIACTSFFPTKPLGCYGDGGAIFVNDKSLADKLRRMARHGQSSRYNHTDIGLNSRLDTIQAAILLAKIEILDYDIERRQKVANIYQSKLLGLKGVELPNISNFSKSAWAQFTIKTKQREVIAASLRHYKVPFSIHYPKPINKQVAYFDANNYFAVAETLSQSVISLPMHAYLSTDKIEIIVDAIRKGFN